MEIEPCRNLIIGSGEAGKYLAWALGKQGEQVIVVERSLIGGSCPNIACLPSKNVISPGVAPTPGYDTLGIRAEALESVLPRIPLGRVGTTEEIAKAILILASDESSYMTGTKLFADGGMAQV